jgi:hypothetical protein
LAALDADHPTAEQNEPVRRLASDTTQNRLKILPEPELDQPQLHAMSAVLLVEYTYSGEYARTPSGVIVE